MSSRQDTVDFIVDQMSNAGDISFKKMFGEYGIYCDAKIVALVCDDKLFVKPTVCGRVYLGDDLIEEPPYPGAKQYFCISGEKWEDREWLSALIKMTSEELPNPIKKQKTKNK
jgi:TfoX/Sxy family transcriptional regulator of competence genes